MLAPSWGRLTPTPVRRAVWATGRGGGGGVAAGLGAWSADALPRPSTRTAPTFSAFPPRVRRRRTAPPGHPSGRRNTDPPSLCWSVRRVTGNPGPHLEPLRACNAPRGVPVARRTTPSTAVRRMSPRLGPILRTACWWGRPHEHPDADGRTLAGAPVCVVRAGAEPTAAGWDLLLRSLELGDHVS